MKTLTIILFIFFVFFLVISLFTTDMFTLFMVIFLAFIIAFICLSVYLGLIQGIILGLFYIIMPFLVEYLLFIFKLPLFNEPLIKYLSLNRLSIPITMTSLFFIFTLPLLFMSALFFAQKIKLLANIKNYHKTFIVITSTLLVGLNFLALNQNQIDYQTFIKWLLVSLIVNILICKFFKFKPNADEFYKELPIVIFLSFYGTNALKRFDTLDLTITVILTMLYLILLYNEYKIRKLKFSLYL